MSTHLFPTTWVYAFAGVALAVGPALADDYPRKTLRIVSTEAGGGTDFVARVVAQGLSQRLAQQVVVENRPSGVIPGQVVAQANPDGYTLLITSSSLWVGPLFRKTPYDPVSDFIPISLLVSYPSILVVHSSLPVKSVRQLIDLAKSRPGELNYGAPAIGTPTHLAAELFKAMARVNIVAVNYKGTGPAVNALAGGHVQLMFGAPTSVAPHVQAGKLRALAVTSAKPSALAPGLPPVGETVPGYAMAAETAMFAPKGTPAVIIERLNQETNWVLNQPALKTRLFNAGVETVGSSPKELGNVIRSSMTTVGKVIVEAGMRID